MIAKTALLALAMALALPAAASGVPLTYMATLNGPSEFPANASPGSGSATVTYDDVAHTLAVDAVWSGLEGTTTAAHIHCCIPAPPANPLAGVATATPTFPGFPGGVQAGSYSQTFVLLEESSFNSAFVTANGGVAGAEAALAAGLSAGTSYFNIHSTSFSGGEIRGFLVLVPEPSTALLVGLGAIGLATSRRHAERVCA